MDDALIEKALLEGNYVRAEDIEKAHAYSTHHHGSITEYLFAEELLNKSILGEALAEHLHREYVDLSAGMPSEESVRMVTKDFAVFHHMVMLGETKDGIAVATDLVDAAQLIKDLGVLFPGKPVQVYFTFPEDVDAALSLYKEKLATRFSEIIAKEKKVAPEIVEQIIEDAIQLKASDIHLEPQETEVLVRFRIDGVLQEAGTLPKEYFENILNRVKIQARLRIDEHMKTQDGAIRYKGTTSADLRVSIIPTITGEKVVMRILGEYLRTLSLSELGLSYDYQTRLSEMANRPYGMIIVVGPTGSGKTTTLYALLRLLNDSEVNITTIEDPVEYRVPRINQVQVNEASNLTFATGLRTIVRQDPDIILVGEVRDLETAEIAVNAALTGHLLLTSFHANDASTVIPRLLDMKVEPFMLASTLMIIVAERLVRKICNECKVSEEISKKALQKRYPKIGPFLHGDMVTLYRGKGCNNCGGTGFHGQVGIFEFIEISPRIEALVLENPSSEQIEKVAREEGMKTLFEDGLTKALAGITTIEELMRVALPPSSIAAAPSSMTTEPSSIVDGA